MKDKNGLFDETSKNNFLSQNKFIINRTTSAIVSRNILTKRPLTTIDDFLNNSMQRKSHKEYPLSAPMPVLNPPRTSTSRERSKMNIAILKNKVIEKFRLIPFSLFEKIYDVKLSMLKQSLDY